MKSGRKRTRAQRYRLRSRMASRSLSRSLSRSFSGGKRTRNRRHIRRSHKQRGGYGQFQNNQPITPTYQVAGINLPASQLALANPAPYTVLSNSTNCVDNYSRFTNTGFPSRGH